MPKAKKRPQKSTLTISSLLHKWYILPIAYSILFGLMWLGPRLNALAYGAVDPSFIYGVEKAAINHLSFGTQFIATYGPLGYAAVNFLPQDNVKMMVWELAAVVAAGFGVYLLSRLYLVGKKRNRILLSLILLVALSWTSVEFLYLDIFLLYILIFIKDDGVYRRYLTYILPIVGALLSLVEFTIGGVLMLALALAVIFQSSELYPAREKTRQLIKVLASYFVVLIPLAYILGTTNIFEYIITNLRLSSGFSDAMSLTSPVISLGTRYFFLAIVALVAWSIYKLRRQSINYIFLAPILFYVWKYAMVRQDEHVFVAVEVIPVLILIIIFSAKKLEFNDGFIPGLVLVLCVMAIWSSAAPYSDYDRLVDGPFENIASANAIKFFEVNSKVSVWTSQSRVELAGGKLPASMLKVIGKSGVDVFPWETDIIYANDLTWDNRPSPFSYETYNPQFDQANANFFAKHGPPFIVWHSFGPAGINGLDGKNYLWDEPMTLSSILQHYKLIQSNNTFALLERTNSNPNAVRRALSPVQKIGSNLVNVPASAGLVCADISVHNTVKQSLSTFLVRERPFYLALTYNNGSVQIYRFVRETAPDGLLINQLPLSWPQLINLLQFHRSTDVVEKLSVLNEPSTTIQYESCLN